MKDHENSFAAFEQQVREALAQLYHPGYRPPQRLLTVLGVDAQRSAEAVRETLIQVIEALKPSPGTPPNTRSWRLYLVLAHRYVEARTQEETAELLSITPRHLRREQQEAVHLLARRLWEGSPVGDTAHSGGDADEATAWRSQVHQELAALHRSAPGAVADVAEAIEGALKVGQTLAARHGVQMGRDWVEAGLLVSLHPSALRQVLMTAIEKLTQRMAGGRIVLGAARAEDMIKITVTATPVSIGPALESALIGEILAAQQGAFVTQQCGSQVKFQINLSPVALVTVLVVDDNTDLVHFYHRFVANTRYQIVHAPEGHSIFAAIEQVRPDIVVLDVMLPDSDGWELLARLTEHPATRAIPIIVCSVVRREELASALHAALYLPKPVRRQQFIQALDQVLVRASTAMPPAPAPHTTAC
jgi:CheY-like chemotaxis protein